MVNLSTEIRLATCDIIDIKKNYQKSLPQSAINRRKEEVSRDVSEGLLKKNYDIDCIAGFCIFTELKEILKTELLIQHNNIKPQIKNMFIENLDRCYSTTSCRYKQLGIIELPLRNRINIFVMSIKYRIKLHELKKVIRIYNNKLKEQSLNEHIYKREQDLFEGIVRPVNFIFLEEALIEVLGHTSFLYFESIGTKKVFNSENYTYLCYAIY